MSGWDGSNALETQSNLCGYYAFISRFLDELTSLSSLPNVSRSQPLFRRLAHLISALTASPPMLSQVRCRLLVINYSLMRFDRYLLRPYSRRPVLGPPIIFSGISFFVNPVQTQIFYANNATNISAQTALTTSWMGPSITPLTNLNSGFRVYEVDSAVRDAYSGLNRFILAQIFTRHLTSSMLIRELHTTPTHLECTGMTARGTGGGVMYTYIPAWMRKPSLVLHTSTSTVRVMHTVRISAGVRMTH